LWARFKHLLEVVWYFLLHLVSDSEYNQSAGTKPILSPSCNYFASPAWRAQLLLLLWQLRIFTAAAAVAAADFYCCCLLRAHPRHPAPLIWGREVYKKKENGL
jgi:hypothetical protein